MTTSDIIAALAFLVAVASFGNSWWQGRRSNRIAEEANAIAANSFALAKAKAMAEEDVFVQPIRWDSGSNRVVFRVAANGPVAEVEFEFMNYASAGGKLRRTMVAPGEIAIAHGEFVHERGTLAVPESKKFAATARWRRRASDDWKTCGRYLASKDRHFFAPVES